ncbi:MAG: VCBS repeat-containing protein, partial [Pseudomonadota bacterium]
IVLAAMIATASADDPPLTTGFTLVHDLPPNMPAIETTRTVIGDFTGDLRPEVCMLASKTAYLSFGPNCFPRIEQIPADVISSPVKDIEFLPRADGPGAFLFLTDNGIEVLSADQNGYVHEGTVSGYGWAAAHSLRVLDYNGDDRPDVVGVSGNRLRLLRIRDFDGTRVFENDAAGGGAIYEIEPLDWNHDGKDEVAVRLDNRVEVRIQVPWPAVITFQTPEAPVLLQAVEFLNQGDRLAVIAWSGGGVFQSLHLFGQDGSALVTHLGPVDITASDSGDTNGDGYGELALVRRNNYLMPYLINRYIYDPDHPFLVAPESAFLFIASGLPASNNRAEPVFYDLDNEGDLDLTVVLGDDQVLLVQRNTREKEHLSWVMISDDYMDTRLYARPSPNLDTLHLLIEEPEKEMEGINGIEIRVWRQENITTPAIFYNKKFIEVTQGFISQNVTFEIDEPDPPFDAVYTFELRPVIEENGIITNAGPTTFFFYTTRSDYFYEIRPIGIDLPNYDGQWQESIRDQESHYGGIGPTPSGPTGTGGFDTPPGG